MESLILIGGGDHATSCIDVIEQQGKYRIAGIIDKKERLGQKVLGYEIIGTDDDLSKLSDRYRYFFIGVGHVLSAEARINIYRRLKELNVILPIIISPLAYVSKHATIGEGSIIMPFCVIDIQARIGNNCVINHHTTLGHEATLGDHCHVSANCVLGKCTLGSGTFVGGNSWVTNGITVAPGTVIGSGSNVIRSISEPGIYAGNPARKIK